MGVFGKGEEYVDYTLLKKKGLLKAKEEQVRKSVKTEGGFIDFTSMRNEPSSNNSYSNSTTAPETNTNNFGFLADMASSAINSQVNSSPFANFDSVLPSTSASELPGSADGKEFNALKIKVDDLDYKIDRFIERIDKLEEKLARFG